MREQLYNNARKRFQEAVQEDERAHNAMKDMIRIKHRRDSELGKRKREGEEGQN